MCGRTLALLCFHKTLIIAELPTCQSHPFLGGQSLFNVFLWNAPYHLRCYRYNNKQVDGVSQHQEWPRRDAIFSAACCPSALPISIVKKKKNPNISRLQHCSVAASRTADLWTFRANCYRVLTCLEKRSVSLVEFLHTWRQNQDTSPRSASIFVSNLHPPLPQNNPFPPQVTEFFSFSPPSFISVFFAIQCLDCPYGFPPANEAEAPKINKQINKLNKQWNKKAKAHPKKTKNKKTFSLRFFPPSSLSRCSRRCSTSGHHICIFLLLTLGEATFLYSVESHSLWRKKKNTTKKTTELLPEPERKFVSLGFSFVD